MIIGPTQQDVTNALRTFLLAVLPEQTDVILAVQNRVPQPKNPKFALMSPLRFQRLRTNLDTFEDVKFTGVIDVDNLTVTDLTGTVLAGALVFGEDVPQGTKILSQNDGPPGGEGVYVIGPTASTPVSARTMSAGSKLLEQGAQVTIQIDFHSDDDDGLIAGDMAQIVSTVLRDERGVQIFEDMGTTVRPLYADDPRYMPFVNGEQQFEWRWILECQLQVNQVVRVAQQFFDSVAIDVISVDERYPVT